VTRVCNKHVTCVFVTGVYDRSVMGVCEDEVCDGVCDEVCDGSV